MSDIVKKAIKKENKKKERDYIDKDKLIIEKADGYYYLKKLKDSEVQVKITNFFIEIKDVVLYKGNDDEKRTLNLQIEGNGKKIIGEFSARETTQAIHFSEKVRSLITSFSCYEMNTKMLDALIRYIHLGIKIKDTIVVDKVGYISEYDIWVFKNGVSYNKKFYEFDKQDTVEFGTIKIKLKTKIINQPIYCEKEYYLPKIKKDIIKDFRYMFCGGGGDLVLGFLISSLFVNSLPRELNPFPLLFVNGKKGSGKTTAVATAIKILGLDTSAENIENTSKFVDDFELSNISSLPLWRDEYKNNYKTEQKNGALKSYFDRNGGTRGNFEKNGNGSFGGLTTIPINATLLLSGEQTPRDDAVFSRICLVDVNSNRGDDAEIKYNEINRRSDYYGTVIKIILEKNNFSELTEKYKIINKKIKRYLRTILLLEKRILNVYSPVLAGFFFFNDVILGKNLFEDKEYLENTMTEIGVLIKEKQKEEEEEDSVNEFFGIILDMYLPSQKGYESLSFFDNYILENDTHVQIAYPHFFKKYESYQNRLRKAIETKTSMKKNILSEFFGSQESTMKSNGYVGRSIKIHKDSLKGNLKLIMENYQNFKKNNILDK